MKALIVAILGLLSIINIEAHNRELLINGVVNKVTITDDYSLLFSLKIAPTSCSEELGHGPIVITDSLSIKNLVETLNMSTKAEKKESQDICFKVNFHLKDRIIAVCMNCGDSGQMFIEETGYEYNENFFNNIVNLIEATGVKKPRKKLLPPGFYEKVVVNGTIKNNIRKQPHDIIVKITTLGYYDGQLIKVTKEIKVKEQGDFRIEFDSASKLEVTYSRNSSILKKETYKLNSNTLELETKF